MNAITTPRADACTPTKAGHKPAPRRAPALPFPDLPDAEQASDTEFWRIVFLRELAKLQVGRTLLQKALHAQGPGSDAGWHFMHDAVMAQTQKTHEAFAAWVRACGGLAHTAPHGAVAGALQ